MAKSNDPKAEALSESQAATEADNAAAMARTENVQPTPTQAENDAARLGFSSVEELDDKEPDGSAEVEAPAPAPVKREPGTPTFARKE